MQVYRIYRLDKKGKIAGFPYEINAATDRQALRLSAQAFAGEAIEVWREAALVTQFSLWQESEKLETEVELKASEAAN